MLLQNFSETYCESFSTRRHLCSKTRQVSGNPVFVEKSIPFQFDCLIFSPTDLRGGRDGSGQKMVVAWSSVCDQELERILVLPL